MIADQRRLRRRRAMGRRFVRVIAPVCVVVVVGGLAVATVAQIGPASGPDRRIVDRSFAVLAGTIVVRADASGVALRRLRRDGASLDRLTFFSDLDAMATGSSDDDRSLDAGVPPTPGGGVATGCLAALDRRARALAQVRGTLENLVGGRDGVGGGQEADAARALHVAGAGLESADASWAACRRALRRAPGAARLPPSTWISDPGAWDPAPLAQFVSGIVASASLGAVHHLVLTGATTDPVPVPDQAGSDVVPLTSTLFVQVVVADRGNVDEGGVSVVVTAAAPGSPRAPSEARTKLDVGAGGSVALKLGPLSVRPGTSYVVQVTATPRVGTAVSTSFPVLVSPPVPTTTTTTTAPATTTTTTTTPPTKTATAATGVTTTKTAVAATGGRGPG